MTCFFGAYTLTRFSVSRFGFRPVVQGFKNLSGPQGSCDTRLWLRSNMTFERLITQFEAIGKASSQLLYDNPIGKSREGRDIHGFHFGSGTLNISLIAGCHADEPVGPQFLTKLVNTLSTLYANDPLLTDYQWCIVPDANPDGHEKNLRWWKPESDLVDLCDYLRYRVRELPGEDVEFGFPRHAQDPGARVENQVIYRWWKDFGISFDLHASLHGMGFAAGPWYLVESAWKDSIDFLKRECLRFVLEKSYRPHDVERQGEKGFFRLGKGFCTRPDSENMRKYFLEQGDEDTASLFFPSSMETMRSFGGDCLTIVSEMPLFLLPDVGINIGPPDEAALHWKERIARWQTMLNQPEEIEAESRRFSLRAMNISDQMRFQWHFICSALEQIRQTRWGQRLRQS